MAEETKKTTAEASCVGEEVGVSHVPVAEKPAAAADFVKEPPVPESELEKVEKPAPEEVVEAEKEKGEGAGGEKIAESVSFKEESNKVDDLVDPEKKALEEFKLLIQEALAKREFTAPPPPPPAASTKEEPPQAEEKKEEEAKHEKKEEPKTEEKSVEEAPKTEEITKAAAAEAPDDVPAPPPAEEEVLEKKTEEKAAPPPAVEPSAVGKVEEKAEAVEEEIKETIFHEVTAPAQQPCEEPAAAPGNEEEKTTPQPPEEVSLWGVSLLADERSDVVLLKFLRARDFKVKEAFSMLKNVVAWRKEFKIDDLLEEEGIGDGLERVVYIHGVDKEGHPVCYNAFGEFQDTELYNKTFADAEKRTKFLRWYIQFLEKNVKNLDFSPDGTCTFVQITDLKNSPGLILFKKELRQATNQALQLLQDNYPEFVAKQVFINVPWWYIAYNRMISPFLTQRTKSKFVFAGPTKTAETLFKYIAPEQVPIQYGGLSKEGDQELTIADPVTEEIIKPTTKHTVEIPITEACTLVWEVRVVGWDVSYGAEFVPSAEGGYTWILQKSRKILTTDEQAIFCSFKIGEPGKVVLTFDNQTSKKKKLLYRSKAKPGQ